MPQHTTPVHGGYQPAATSYGMPPSLGGNHSQGVLGPRKPLPPNYPRMQRTTNMPGPILPPEQQIPSLPGYQPGGSMNYAGGGGGFNERTGLVGSLPAQSAPAPVAPTSPWPQPTTDYPYQKFGGRVGSPSPQPTPQYPIQKMGGSLSAPLPTPNLDWRPGPSQPMPPLQIPGYQPAAPAPRGPIFNNNPYAPVMPVEQTNSGGYWHDPSGQTGQAANASMGGSMVYGTPGDPGSFTENMNAANTRNWLAGMGQGSMANAGLNNMAAMTGLPGGMASGMAGMAGASGNPLIDAYVNAMNAANQANQQRYDDILGGWQSARDWASGLMDTLGGQQRKDTETAFNKQQEELKQSMMNRGLTSSTVTDNLSKGITRTGSEAQARLAESLTREKLNTLLPIQEKQLNFMERKTEQGPDMGLFAKLMEMYGSAGGEQGGGGGGGGGPMMFNMGNPFGGALSYGMGGMGGGWAMGNGGARLKPRNSNYMRGLNNSLSRAVGPGTSYSPITFSPGTSMGTVWGDIPAPPGRSPTGMTWEEAMAGITGV